MSRRIERYAGQLVKEVSELVSEELTDPRLGFVTITQAEVSADLSLATIYFTVHGGEKEKNASLAALISARKYLRAELGRRIRAKRVPELRFEYDDSIDQGMKIFEKIREIREKDTKSEK